MNLSEAILTEESMLLAHIDSIPKPSNSDLEPLVTHLFENRFDDWQRHPEAERLSLALIRLRGRSLLATSEETKARVVVTSLDSWLNIQMSRYTNN
jgi:hypothetical protein